MRILYFTQFYKPESIAAAFRACDHARYWAKAGCDVVVFTGWPNYPTGRVFDGYKVERLGEERDGDVRVLRSKSVVAPNTSMARRVLGGGSWLAYGILNCVLQKRRIGPLPDVVLATSGTVFAAMVGRFFAKRNRVPLVVEFRDLTYRQMAATGSDGRGWKVRLMRRLELSLCRDADRVVALTEGFKEALVAEGVPAEKIDVVPNGADIVPCRHEWSGAGALRLGYFGTMGISQDVPATLDLASALAKTGARVSYLLVGEGAARSLVEEGVASGAYPFAELRHAVSKDELEPLYASVDLTVVSLQKSGGFAGTIPSKIFQSFARGVPVLFCGPEGEACRLVRDSGAGLALTGTAEEAARALADFASDPELPKRLARMSESAVEFMEAGYTRRAMAERTLRILEGVRRRRLERSAAAKGALRPDDALCSDERSSQVSDS